MINLCAKFEVSVSTDYDDMKGNPKRGKWSGLGVIRVIQGQWKQHHLTECTQVPINLPQ